MELIQIATVYLTRSMLMQTIEGKGPIFISYLQVHFCKMKKDF